LSIVSLTSRHQSHQFKDNFFAYPYEMTRNTAKLHESSDTICH